MMDLVGYDHAREHADHVFGAQYDDIRERYASEMRDLEMWEASEREHCEYMQKVYEAGFGDDWEAYEAHFQQLDKDIQQSEREHSWLSLITTQISTWSFCPTASSPPTTTALNNNLASTKLTTGGLPTIPLLAYLGMRD